MADSFEIASLTVSLDGDQAIVRFGSEDDLCDMHTTDLEQRLTAELQEGGRLAGKRLVVALEDMPALSSRQLGTLMSIQRASGTGGKLTVRGARRNVRELFALTKMGEFFDY